MHIPTPWLADDANSEGEPNEVWHIYAVAGYDTSAEVKVAEAYTKANAMFIVQACNSHDELLEALQCTMPYLLRTTDNLFSGGLFEAYNKARAAIQKATK